MAKQPLEILTESMFYVLMALRRQERCGAEIAAFVEEKTGGAVSMGPGTLYTLLGRFQEEGLIEEGRTRGRRRTYRLTEDGLARYRRELERLRRCVANGESEEPGEEEAP